MESYNPILDNVLLEILPPEEKVGNIIMPMMNENILPRQFATVLAVGPGKRMADGDRIPMQVKVGDIIVIGEQDHCVPVMNAEKRRLFIYKEQSIACVVDEL